MALNQGAIIVLLTGSAHARSRHYDCAVSVCEAFIGAMRLEDICRDVIF